MTLSFPHRHLLDIERLSATEIELLLDRAAQFALQNRRPHKKSTQLQGRTVVNLFYENSTRTRTSFEIAAKRLGADVVNVPLEHSSVAKGETFLDTVLTLDAMQIDALVIRHNEEGIPQFIAPHVKAHVINAGDGKHEHPTQALLDALTLRRHKGKIAGLIVAICGDVAHSRVARSNAHLLTKLGAMVRMIAPAGYAQANFTKLGIECTDDLAKGIKDADAVMTLRIQHERIGGLEQTISQDDYVRDYRIDHHRLLRHAKPDVIVMHPGPTNRGVEITDELFEDPAHSVVREQVEMGVAVRMAVLDVLLNGTVS